MVLYFVGLGLADEKDVTIKYVTNYRQCSAHTCGSQHD